MPFEWNRNISLLMRGQIHCINYINEEIGKKLETGRPIEYCKKCKEPTNPVLADYMANSDYYKVREKVFGQKEDNTK